MRRNDELVLFIRHTGLVPASSGVVYPGRNLFMLIKALDSDMCRNENMPNQRHAGLVPAFSVLAINHNE